MIFSDPSGDDTIHPVPILQLPDINPPPTRAGIVHRTANSVIPYKKYPRTKPKLTKTFAYPENIDHVYYKVKDILDDGTGSSIEKFANSTTSFENSPRAKIQQRKSSMTKPSKYLDDGSEYLRQEISQSEDRVRSIRAGRALHFFFPETNKKFVEPNRNFYNKQRLGTPFFSPNSKELQFYTRKRQVSLMNSSPHRPFIFLPSLKDILLNSETNKTGIFNQGADLSQKFEKLEKSFNKRSRNTTIYNNTAEKKLVKIVKGYLKAENVGESLVEDPVSHMLSRFKEFEVGKERLKNELKDLLATQKYDRPESIWLKYKHFKTSVKTSVYQGRMLDIWNMRMEAEKERLENYRGMMKQICWYRDILWFCIEKCHDISPYTYYILDYIKALTEECIVINKEKMRTVTDEIPESEKTKGLATLINKINNDIATMVFEEFN